MRLFRTVPMTVLGVATIVGTGTGMAFAADETGPQEGIPVGVIAENTAVTQPGGQDAPVVEGAGDVGLTDTGYVGAVLQEPNGDLTLRFDRATVLSSEEATEAGYPEPAGAYLVQDDEDLLRDVTIADGATVTQLSGSESTPSSLNELVRSLPGGQPEVFVELTYNSAGEVTAIDEVYLP